ncbi:MAG: methyl-accepting chemotaxis protein [Pseudomonadota bacterium]
MQKIMGNLKMFYKMMISPLVVIFFLIVLAFLSFNEFSKQKASTHDIFNNRFNNYQESAAVIIDLTNVHLNFYKIIAWANASYDSKKIEAFTKEQLTLLEKTVGFMTGVVGSQKINDKEKGYYEQALAEALKYNQTVRQVISMVAADDTSTASIIMGQADDGFQLLNKSLSELMLLEKTLSKAKYDESVAGIESVIKQFVALSIVAIAISLLLNILMGRMIVTPLHETVAVIEMIADGDLTQEITVNSRDEIGMLANSLNQMVEKMGEAVGQSVATSQMLSEAASDQAAALEETSSSMEEMSAMIAKNAENTARANELMVKAKQMTESANGSMDELTQSMSDIGHASEQTQKIVKTIDEIAFQTNLLALNAAVEAARAGEAGAGFAVVADEVRNLAMRAAEAARNTSGLMGDIVNKVKAGEHLVEVTSSSFKQVGVSSAKVVELMGEIAAASQEQSEGISQVNKAVVAMSTVTQQNAASSEELAATMAMFKTNYTGMQSPSRRKGPVKVGRSLAALPEKTGADNRF